MHSWGKKKLLTAKVAEKGRRERGEDIPFSWILLCSWSERDAYVDGASESRFLTSFGMTRER
jgi:hypothetical protein